MHISPLALLSAVLMTTTAIASEHGHGPNRINLHKRLAPLPTEELIDLDILEKSNVKILTSRSEDATVDFQKRLAPLPTEELIDLDVLEKSTVKVLTSRNEGDSIGLQKRLVPGTEDLIDVKVLEKSNVKVLTPRDSEDDDCE